jgi:chromate transporter
MKSEQAHHRVPIRELVRYYLRLGLVGFGGPVALVGQMEREMVGEKKWLTREEMREGIAVCQSLPGPLAIRSASGSRTSAGASGERGRAAGRSSSPTS